MSSYREHLDAAADLLAALPLEHLARGRDHASFVQRLVAERNALEASASAGEALPPVVLVLDGFGEAHEVELTLRTWALQSHPAARAIVAPAPARSSVPGADVLAGSLHDWLVQAKAGFVIFAHGGDVLHPSVAAAVALQARAHAKAVAITWSRLRYDVHDGLAEVRGALRVPGLDPVAWHGADYLGRAVAYSVEAISPALGEAGAAPPSPRRLQAALLASAWAAHPEFLGAYRDELVTPIEPASEPSLERALGTVLVSHARGLVPARSASSISVVIPFRDHAPATLSALRSVARQRTDAKLEVLLVDNQSGPETLAALEGEMRALSDRMRCRLLHYPRPFNHSRQSNLGAREAQGEVLLFLNNDAELQSEDALDLLARWALVEGVATAGGRTLDAQGRVVSAGFRVRLGALAVFDSMIEESTDEVLAGVTRSCAGNSFACAAIAAARFGELGGLDELRFPAGYNDVDFCLRASRAGYRHVYVGDAVLRHTPGGSRGKTDEVLQKLLLRQEHPWVLGAGLELLMIDTPGPKPIRGKTPLWPQRRAGWVQGLLERWSEPKEERHG